MATPYSAFAQHNNVITSRSAHGVYTADSRDLTRFIERYYGDVNASHSILADFVAMAAGFGGRTYWSDMEAVDLLIVLCELNASPESLTRYMESPNEPARPFRATAY